MSREWYIRTDKRHIQNTFGDIDTTPLTPKEKWQKYKGKYIFWGIEILVVIALLVVAVPPLFRKNPPDYTVTVVTKNPVNAEEHIAALLKPYAIDRDGDGETEIAVRELAVELTADGFSRNPALEALLLSFYTDQYTLFAMEPACYEQYVAAYAEEDVSLFETLNAAAVVNGNGSLLETDKNTHLPTLWWGVRALPAAKDDAQTDAAAHKALLEAFAEKN